MEKIGIETSGRVEIYNLVDEFYEFDPAFLGHGIGFLTYQLNTTMNVGVASVHNDFLQHFIDLGFFGFLIWLLAITFCRVWYFGRKERVEEGILTFMLTLYLVIVSMTDNTMNYPLLTGTLALIMMSQGFEDNAKKEELRLFGYGRKQ